MGLLRVRNFQEAFAERNASGPSTGPANRPRSSQRGRSLDLHEAAQQSSAAQLPRFTRRLRLTGGLPRSRQIGLK